MKGYVQLKNIHTEFKITAPTVNKKLRELGIKKEIKDNIIYIKEMDYSRLKHSLETSNRIKKIIDIDKEEQEKESDKEKIYKLQIEHLSDKIKKLEENVDFQKKQIESFHGIIRTKEDAIDSLNNQILLLEETNQKELEEKDNEIFSIRTELQEANELKDSFKKELEEYKNRSFRKKLIDLFKK